MFERVGFDPGNRLTQQGDQADAAHLIIDGHAEVILETPSGPMIVATVGTNEIVGEVGFWATRRAGRRCIRITAITSSRSSGKR